MTHSANVSRPSRLGIAVAALATSIALALPAGASAAPASFAAKGDAAARRAVGNGHAAKTRERRHPKRAHQAPAPTKANSPAPTLGGTAAGNGGGSNSAPPAVAPGKTTKPSTGAKVPAATGTTPPPTSTPPVTTPPPATTPPTPGSGLLFSGSRLRDFALLQEAPNAITEVADPLGSGETVLKFTVNDSDVAPVTPTENPRAQALSPDLVNQGQEVWLQTKFLIPADFPGPLPGWVSLLSIYGAPFAGSSPWSIGIDGNYLSWDRNATYNWDTPWKTPLVRGQWTTILMHERFASDGFVEMWVNGVPVTFFAPGSSYNPSRHAATQHLEMKTVDSSNGGDANSVRIAQYRQSGMVQTATLYFGAVKLGTTRAAVGG